MTLPAKALQVLIDLKKELISRDTAEPEQAKKEEKPTQIMRHARTKSRAFQRYCQRGDW